MNNLKDITYKLNNILKQNDLRLINEFENEFIKLESEKETSSMIIYGNRQLIRNAYYLIIMLYEDSATLNHFKTLINDDEGNGRKMVMEFSKKRVVNANVQKKNNEVLAWILNDYYSGLSIRRGCTQTYRYCLPTRYLIDKMIDIINIDNNIYSNISYEELKDISIRNKKTINAQKKGKSKTQSKTVIGNDDIMKDIGSDFNFDEDFDDLI